MNWLYVYIVALGILTLVLYPGLFIPTMVLWGLIAIQARGSK